MAINNVCYWLTPAQQEQARKDAEKALKSVQVCPVCSEIHRKLNAELDAVCPICASGWRLDDVEVLQDPKTHNDVYNLLASRLTKPDEPMNAGIDDETLKLIQRFERIIYISCNPDTLEDNLKTLSHTYKVTKFAMFDQFPYTHHVESGVLLEKI